MKKILKLYDDVFNTIEPSKNPFSQEMRAFAQTREVLVDYIYYGYEDSYNNLAPSGFTDKNKKSSTVTERVNLLKGIGIDVGDECKKLIEFSETCTVGKVTIFVEYEYFIRKLIAQKLKELLESRK